MPINANKYTTGEKYMDASGNIPKLNRIKP